MNYELAKKLKDAGFPLIPWWTKLTSDTTIEEGRIYGDAKNRQMFRIGDEGWVAPTLSELIAACVKSGKKIVLESTNEDWSAEAWDWPVEDGEDIRFFCQVYGSTPEEAAANLWLALHDTRETTVKRP